MSRRTKRILSHGLALAFAAADWNAGALVTNGSEALGEKPSWLRPLAGRILNRFEGMPGVSLLEKFLDRDRAFDKPSSLIIRHWFFPEVTMHEVLGPPSEFFIRPLATSGELARWLDVSHSELEWFADLRQQNLRAANTRLCHYHYTWVPKRSGGHRLLEQPKQRLKHLQRQILSGILSQIPPSTAAHGFVPGRSTKSFVAPHISRRVVVRIDLANFFPSIGFSRVKAILCRVGYPESVASRLAGICSAGAPNKVLEKFPEQESPGFSFHQRQELRTRHLPQGAPSSPALANLAAFALDRRLVGLAKAFGATYTRYADDLAFSGDAAFARQVHGFVSYVASIVLDEGFSVRHRKTRIMFSGRRQHLTGLVVNRCINVPRRDYDRLRAILHSAIQTGLAAQNRDGHREFRAHLLGKIAYIASLHPQRGRRLMKLFVQIPG